MGLPETVRALLLFSIMATTIEIFKASIMQSVRALG